MASDDDFDDVYVALHELMMPCAEKLEVVRDQSGSLYLDTLHIMKNKKPLYFGGIQINKRYVSYHLMPVYVNPGLLDGMSDALRKRMQGKSCFNFVAIDRSLFAELDQLTQAGYEYYKSEGYI